jgi:hypothetical protein
MHFSLGLSHDDQTGIGVIDVAQLLGYRPNGAIYPQAGVQEPSDVFEQCQTTLELELNPPKDAVT